MCALDGRRTGSAIQAEPCSASRRLKRYAFRVEPDLDVLRGENVSKGIRDIRVLIADQSGAHFDYRDSAAKSAVHLSKFQADVATAHDQQILRQSIDAHHAFAGEIRDLLQSGEIRDARAGTDIYEDPVRCQRIQTDRYGVSIYEPRMSRVDRCIGQRA